MKPVQLHAEPERELLDALEYYDQQRPGFGGELRRDFEATVEKVLGNPHGYAVTDAGDVRYASFRRFQYRIVFVDLDDYLWIIAVSHHSRHPRYWSGRLKS